MTSESNTTLNVNDNVNNNDNGNDSDKKSALQDNIESKGKNAYYFAHAHKATGPKWDGKPQPRLLATHSSSGIVGEAGDSTAATGTGTDTTNTTTNNTTTNTEQGMGDLSLSNHAQSLIQSLKEKKSGYDFSKSNITKYAFLDDGKKVKIYIDMKGVGDICDIQNDIQLDWNTRSFSLRVYNYVCVTDIDATDTTDTAANDDKVNKGNKEDVKCLSFGKLYGFISKAAVKVKKDKIIVTLSKKIDEDQDPEDWPTITQKGE
jgi:hypothetical protein